MKFLVKYECGCVGIPMENNFALLVHCCDDYDGDFTVFMSRDMKGKSHTNIDPDSQKRYITRVSRLLSDGYRFRKLKDILS